VASGAGAGAGAGVVAGAVAVVVVFAGVFAGAGFVAVVGAGDFAATSLAGEALSLVLGVFLKDFLAGVTGAATAGAGAGGMSTTACLAGAALSPVTGFLIFLNVFLTGAGGAGAGMSTATCCSVLTVLSSGLGVLE